MTFELNDIEATLRSVTPRTEKHGDDDVFAVSLGFKITTANTILDRLSPTLRDALYKAVPDQEQLPGVEPSTPLLRTRAIDTITLGASFDGWTLAIQHGIDEDAPIKLGDAKVDKFKVTPHEGGSVDLQFRVGSSDIDATEAGLLCAKLGQDVVIALTAPAIQSGPVIDGSAKAFSADHPEAGGLFAQQHEGTGAPGAGDSDDAGTAERGENWPFPQGDGAEAGATASDEPQWPAGADAGAGDAAEFEAGAKEALEKAGVAPRGRRGRKGAWVVE